MGKGFRSQEKGPSREFDSKFSTETLQKVPRACESEESWQSWQSCLFGVDSFDPDPKELIVMPGGDWQLLGLWISRDLIN